MDKLFLKVFIITKSSLFTFFSYYFSVQTANRGTAISKEQSIATGGAGSTVIADGSAFASASNSGPRGF